MSKPAVAENIKMNIVISEIYFQVKFDVVNQEIYKNFYENLNAEFIEFLGEKYKRIFIKGLEIILSKSKVVVGYNSLLNTLEDILNILSNSGLSNFLNLKKYEVYNIMVKGRISLSKEILNKLNIVYKNENPKFYVIKLNKYKILLFPNGNFISLNLKSKEDVDKLINLLKGL